MDTLEPVAPGLHFIVITMQVNQFTIDGQPWIRGCAFIATQRYSTHLRGLIPSDIFGED